MKRLVFVGVVLAVLALSASLVLAATNVIQGGDFEDGSPNPYWAETSTNFGTPLCTVGLCGDGGGTAGPRGGDWWAWFGGNNGGAEVGTLAQDVTLPADSTAELTFWLWIGSWETAGLDYLEAWVDGDSVFYTSEDNATYQSGYVQVTVALGATYAGSTVTVEFEGTDMYGTNTNFSVDDVKLLYTESGEEPTEEPEEAEPVYEQWDPGDTRINPDPAMEVAIYCVADGIDMWGFNDAHFGYVSVADFDAAPATDETPFFTSADGTVRVYHLANGWWGVQKDQVRGDAVETYQ
ncbi:MAG: hypothetical protein JW910_06650, partial [Anaerolineae bacterium]|nr:hypothetical protein [Anaerolineae bacterium]